MPGEETALRKVFNSLSNAVGDLCSLSVESYTGDISAVIKVGDDKDVMDWEALVAEAKKGATGKVKLKMASKYNIDGDATLFIAEGDISPSLQEAHKSAVEAGQSVRSGLMTLLSENIKNLVS